MRVEAISVDDAKRQNFPEGTPDFVSTSVLETMGEAAAVLEPSNDVERLTGQAPRTFRQWVSEHKQAFA